jgi:4-hydroxythreonine-4-phosphate dehydrogenase
MIDPRGLKAPMLIVVGSFSPVSAAQVDAFAQEHAASVIAISPDADPASIAPRAIEAMRSTGVALVQVRSATGPAVGSRAVVARIATALRDAASRCSTLVMTGGDTARAMLEALDVRETFIEGELESGIAVSAPVEPYGFRAVLKAGGFGDNGTFARMNAALARSP